MSLMDRWLTSATRTRGGYPAGDKTVDELTPPPAAAVKQEPELVAEIQALFPILAEVRQTLDAATADAIRQLEVAKAEAVLFRARTTSEELAVEQAEKRWRERNPGLACLVDRVKGGAR